MNVPFNDDPRYSSASLVAMTCWAVTGILLGIAWTMWALGEHHAAMLVAETACVGSAIAAAMQIKCYAAQVCRLVRVTSGLEREDADVREFTGPRR